MFAPVRTEHATATFSLDARLHYFREPPKNRKPVSGFTCEVLDLCIGSFSREHNDGEAAREITTGLASLSPHTLVPCKDQAGVHTMGEVRTER